MIETVQISNQPKSDSRFWIFFRIWDLFWPRFVSDFVLRISDLTLFGCRFVPVRGASFDIRISDFDSESLGTLALAIKP